MRFLVDALLALSALSDSEVCFCAPATVGAGTGTLDALDGVLGAVCAERTAGEEGMGAFEHLGGGRSANRSIC